ncbi:hypothetical protein [Paenibacillus sp. SYP-B4298]|uniref:hypothetical protein n=1 Tax=Paenibacillus sp. SYP-B4298 TaxID=2996034 RepID=UPI0022DDF462|nr:hypothetical protein [Paenibacillus sp. SYP-B4298]
MSHSEFKALLKKINLKPKGVQEIVLEVSDGALDGKIDVLSKLIDGRVAITVDSEIVRYDVQINARTKQPIKTYTIDEHGITEFKPEGEQIEMDLGVPKKAEPIEDLPQEISREVVDEFILSGLLSEPEDIPYPVHDWIARKARGETYLMFSSEAGISSGKIVDIIDEYRQSVAPLAAKWDEWRKAGQPAAQDDEDDDSEELVDNAEQDGEEKDTPPPAAEGQQLDGEGAAAHVEPEHVDDWERELKGESEDGAGEQPDASQPDEAEDLDAYILRERPQFDDIPYDFPALLERQRGGETWREVAETLGTDSKTLAALWSKYKKRVGEQRANGAA